MHQTKKGNQYYFGMKLHLGADVETGLVHHVHGTAANVAEITQIAELLHGEENAVYAMSRYTGVEKRDEHADRPVIWQVVARRSTYSTLSKRGLIYKATGVSSGSRRRPGPMLSIRFARSCASSAM